MVKHDFKVQTKWRGGREEVGTVNGDIISEQISIPAPLGGNGVGTNPDELLVSCIVLLYHLIGNVRKSKIYRHQSDK